ncbi:hypothetical protein [Acetobacterium sp.]|uniref:hypothetical protein n=1 Tax=Acetobacterium sp. TaxID=1872094 RepID=UPI002F40B8B4
MAKFTYTSNVDEVFKKLDSLSFSPVDFSEAFSDEFMNTNTSFKSFQEFIDSSGFKMQSQEDFESIDENELDVFVSANTEFSTFKEMSASAAEIVLKKRVKDLGL